LFERRVNNAGSSGPEGKCSVRARSRMHARNCSCHGRTQELTEGCCAGEALQGRIQEFVLRGGIPYLGVLPVPFPSPPPPFPYLPLSLEVGPLKPARGSGAVLKNTRNVLHSSIFCMCTYTLMTVVQPFNHIDTHNS